MQRAAPGHRGRSDKSRRQASQRGWMVDTSVCGSCHSKAFKFAILGDQFLQQMPHHVDRPTKICPVCGRPFQWRKKWKDVWEEVRYCSERCRRNRNRALPDPSAGPQMSQAATIACQATGIWQGLPSRAQALSACTTASARCGPGPRRSCPASAALPRPRAAGGPDPADCRPATSGA